MLSLKILAARFAIFRGWLLRETSPAAPTTMPDIFGDRTQAIADGIPKIIWCYWEQLNAPAIVQLCVNVMRELNPKCSVHFLNPKTIGEFIPAADMPDFAGWPVQKKANWIRLYLLLRHGGIWVDASTLLTQSLDWVFEAQRELGVEYVGFYHKGRTVRPDMPLVENWFMASVPAGRMISRWFEIYDQQIIHGSIESYLSGLRDRGVYEEFAQGIPAKVQSYLVMYIASSDVLDSLDPKPRMALFNSQETAFFYLLKAGGRRKLRKFLLFQAMPERRPLLIKLRHEDRPKLEFFIEANAFSKSSYFGWAKYLTQKHTSESTYSISS